MSLPTHAFKMLKVYFTQDEMREFSDRIAASVMEKQSLVDEKKSVVSDYTARINEKTPRSTGWHRTSGMVTSTGRLSV